MATRDPYTHNVTLQAMAAYQAYSAQIEHIKQNRPSIPGYTPLYTSGTYDISWAYPLRPPTETEAANTTTIQNEIIQDIIAGNNPGAEDMLRIILQAQNAGTIDAQRASEIAQAFLQWHQDESPDNHSALTALLTESFPGSQYNPHDQLRIQAERLLVPGLPPEEAPYSNTMALTRDSSLTTIQAIALEHIKPGTNVILPVPFYFGYPLVTELAGGTLVTADTQNTGYKLTPEVLETAITTGNVKPGDWLIFTNPDNITLSPYSRDELQKLANVIAKHGLNVLADELLANIGTGEHLSLAAFEATGPGGYSLKDHVITISGNSKQIDSKSKFGIACGPRDMMTSIIHKSEDPSLALDTRTASLHAATLTHITPEARQAARQEIADSYDTVTAKIKEINAAAGENGLILNGSTNGHLATLTLSPQLLAKTGITNSEDLQQYIYATTGISTHPLRMMGITDPIVRINTTQFIKNAGPVTERLSQMVQEISQSRGPRMEDVQQAFAALAQQQGKNR